MTEYKVRERGREGEKEERERWREEKREVGREGGRGGEGGGREGDRERETEAERVACWIVSHLSIFNLCRLKTSNSWESRSGLISPPHLSSGRISSGLCFCVSGENVCLLRGHRHCWGLPNMSLFYYTLVWGIITH